jgi:uncharacterized membrane protein (DUF2068 family)
MHRPPGTEKPRRFRPRFHWELLVCGTSGHELLGMNVRTIRPEDAVVAREENGLRWYRCVRCDSWLPLPLPAAPARETLPPRAEIELPRRGKALRDRVVLRIIAIDRAIHFVVLALLSVVVFLFAGHEIRLRRAFYRVADAVQGSSIGPHHHAHGFLGSLEHIFELRSSTLYAVAAAAAGYAVIEGVEAVGLWYQKRWAEYLTFIATTLFLPYEVYELSRAVSAFKVIAFIINIAIAVYLLYAKRLFGLRGGAEAEKQERERDVGWEALERTAPAG